MSGKFECGLTASLLDSGVVLTKASHCAAVIGVAGTLLAHSGSARLIFAVPTFCWPVACYFSVRVAIDASLFRELALENDDGAPVLDKLMHRRGLAREKPLRTIDDRSAGAVKLWKRLIAITGIQI
ncbi:MAG: hypothetical protein JOZ22_14450, partial [Acidobacteriia bacterium]|nr:hypothetical protein [Terriglobia bacterium]